MFIKSFYLFVLLPSCTEVMNVDKGNCFLFSLHVVVINVDTGICVLSPSCSSREFGCRNLFSFLFM